MQACKKIFHEENIVDTDKSFKKWALKNHPDKGGDTKKFQLVNSCRDLLKNRPFSPYRQSPPRYRQSPPRPYRQSPPSPRKTTPPARKTTPPPRKSDSPYALILLGKHTKKELLEAIKNNGANTEIYYKGKTFVPLTLIMSEIKKDTFPLNKKKILELLINSGAKIQGISHFTTNPSILQFLYDNGDKSAEDLSFLFLALKSNDYTFVKKVLELGKGNLNKTDSSGATPLIFVSKNQNKVPTSIIKLLLDSGADINTMDNQGKNAYDYYLRSINPEKRFLELLNPVPRANSTRIGQPDKSSNWDYTYDCMNKILNSSSMRNKDVFYNSNTMDMSNLAVTSPKLANLLKNIQDLDQKDMKKYGKQYKHFIFTNAESTYGLKMIATAFIKSGMNLVMKSVKKNKSLVGTVSKDLIQKGKDENKINFAFLSSKPIKKVNYSTRNIRKDLIGDQGIFNNRFSNVYGEDIRIIILDSGFTEGIDLFDIKYCHIFDSFTNSSDRNQAIGRALRYCGQSSLPFKKNGWVLKVFHYRILHKEVDLGKMIAERKVDLKSIEEKERIDKILKDASVNTAINS